MGMVDLPPTGRLRQVILASVGLAVCFGILTPTSALARRHGHASHAGTRRATPAHQIVFRARHAPHARAALHVRPGSYTPPFSAYAVDGNSGRVLYGRDENEPRHPASLTKVMTLYLLFDQLEKKRLTLDSELQVSHHAAAQEPTKLGLRPGATIRVEDAIKAIVTKSANDMAVAVAEQIGGDEETFARLMTQKAHALGMSRTLYRNASGLPNDEQLTTAKDMVTLGRAIHDRFPRYYRFFSTPSFSYHGQYMANHNHLMEQVEGMDGIKTGYTRLSGFNLLSSVSRHGHYLVSVVLGGKTRLGRDRIMADLIDAQLDKCATTRTASIVEENAALEQVAEAIPVVQHVGEPAPNVEPVSEDEAENAPGAAAAEPRALAAKPAVTPAPVQVAALEEAREPRARPAFVSGVARPAESDRMATGSIRPHASSLDGSTSRATGQATATPSSRRTPRHLAAQEPKPVKVAKVEAAPEPAHAAPAHGGWVIQIGATDDMAKANELLSRAKAQSHGALGAAKPFTEKVQKGSGTLFRARFAGLEAGGAENACKALKQSGFSCFATRN